MNEKRFFIGLHQPGDGIHFDAACISINRLRKRKKPVETLSVLVDSAAFTELNIHGRYRHGVEEYAAALYRLHTQKIVNIAAAVAQDYMCEAFMLAKTGLTIADHQRLTIERYDALVAELERLFGGPCPFHVLPVLQGYSAADYVRHVRAYGDRLKPGMWVGVGSVCKRNGNPRAIANVLMDIKRERPDMRLHGFGVKLTAIANSDVHRLLDTADSMAWSSTSRWKQDKTQNKWQTARAYADRLDALIGRPLDPAPMDFFGSP